MPLVFLLDPPPFQPYDPWEYVDLSLIYEEFKKLGRLGAYYHRSTSVCVVGAKDREEAIEAVLNYLVEWEYDEFFIACLEVEYEHLDNVHDIWYDIPDERTKKRIIDYHKSLFKLAIHCELNSGLPGNLESFLKKEFVEYEKSEREYEKVESKDFKKVPLNELLLIKSRVRSYLKKKGFGYTAEVIDGEVLNNAIIDILDGAIAEARVQNRETVEIEDFKQPKEISVDETLFVKSHIRDYIKSKGLTPGSNVFNDGGVIDKAIANLLDRAIENARKDDRSEFVGGKDFQ